MDSLSQKSVTAILHRIRAGDKGAVNELVPVVYEQLRLIARRLLRGERPGHTLQPTAVVHEAYLRLVEQGKTDWKDRAHFIAVAALAMRRVLVEHARRRGALKRGGAVTRVSLNEGVVPGRGRDVGMLELNTALSSLAGVDERKARVASLRLFGGLEPDEIAQVLEVSRRTAERDWHAARAWLISELRDA